MSATVLVVGGTGALGAPTVQRLRKDGYQVRLLVRDPKRLPHRSDDLEYARGDLEDHSTAPNTTGPPEWRSSRPKPARTG